VPGRKVFGQLGKRPAAHEHVSAAAGHLWQHRRDAGQPGRPQILIQPVDHKQQVTVFGFGAPGSALP
jgi:hypothetical protein